VPTRLFFYDVGYLQIQLLIDIFIAPAWHRQLGDKSGFYSDC
jgi:hypothetical protein